MYIHVHTHIHTRTYTHTHTRTYTHMHTYTRTYTHTHTYIYTHAHIHTRTYTHTYIHTYKHPWTLTYNEVSSEKYSSIERSKIKQRLTLVHRDRNTYLPGQSKLELLIYEEKQANFNRSLLVLI